MAGTEYGKIYSPFVRHIDGPDKHKFDWGNWSRPEFEALAELEWHWTEKIDGTNVRVIWDGHRVSFGGRTDDAQMPIKLLDVLKEMFPEELLEQQFHGNPAVLYGEGYGAGILKGGVYRPDMAFVLFDVRVGDWWLLPDTVTEVGQQMGIPVVPEVFPLGQTSPVPHSPIRVVHYMKYLVGVGTPPMSTLHPEAKLEGWVGRPPVGLMGRDGDRLMLKVKAKDFR